MDTIITICEPPNGLLHCTEIFHKGVAIHDFGAILDIEDRGGVDRYLGGGCRYYKISVVAAIDDDAQVKLLIGLVGQNIIQNLFHSADSNELRKVEFELRDVGNLDYRRVICPRHMG